MTHGDLNMLQRGDTQTLNGRIQCSITEICVEIIIHLTLFRYFGRISCPMMCRYVTSIPFL